MALALISIFFSGFLKLRVDDIDGTENIVSMMISTL